MKEKHKGIIISNPKELYMEIDHKYLLNYIPGKVISKYSKVRYSDNNKVNKTNKNKKSKKNNIELSFGDILSIYGTKQKFIFICKTNRFIYTSLEGSEEIFTGIKRLTIENISSKYDELNSDKKQKLLSNLDKALELDKFIPQKAKESISSLVLKSKNK